MKDFYQILGIEEDASAEEIEARWAELMKQYRSPSHKRESKTDEKIKEIDIAYQVLSDPSKRKEYDFERFLKRSILKGAHQRRKERYDRRKRLIIRACIVLFFLIGGSLVFKMAQLTLQQKPVPATPPPVPEAERVTSSSKPVPGEISKVPDQKRPQTVPEQIIKSQEATSPVAKLPKKELESEEKIAKATLQIEKPIFKEMPEEEVSKSPKPILEERPKVEEPKPVSIERPPAIAHVPVSEGAKKPEVAIVNEKEKPKVTPKEIPTQVAKEVVKEAPKGALKEVSQSLPKEEPKTILQEPPVPQPSRPKVEIVNEKEKPKVTPKEVPKEVSQPLPKEEPKTIPQEPPVPQPSRPKVEIVNEKEKPKPTPKEVPKEVSQPLPKEEPKEVSRALPKQEPKTIPQEPPIAQPGRPKEVEPTEQKRPVAPMPPPKPAPPIAAIPPMPHPFVKENEVKQFLAKYVDRYLQKDIEGFLSFFSPMAIQNQKDGMEDIRKIYSRQFELYERFGYQLKNPRIEILEKSVKVKAFYEIEQFSKKGETKRLRGEIEWDLVKEGGELKILTIQYRHEKPK